MEQSTGFDVEVKHFPLLLRLEFISWKAQAARLFLTPVQCAEKILTKRSMKFSVKISAGGDKSRLMTHLRRHIVVYAFHMPTAVSSV